ncbi:FixH family protein [Bacillus sp. V59.32b]|uniref:FixH family protein n=1 Tax=Bacillus sp. V59.32b TaxID=1758642 RepID=UPI000E3B97EB|nr:FixH family protein [Bacillus sp. V59.32b]RFU61737.1 hypothetical protein D0463_14615 [Bacillus sp. V59.32b]
MKKLFVLTIAVFAFLGGCSNSEEKDEVPKMLEVDLSIEPGKAEAGETVLFEAEVMYGKEKVTDADEVTFEIWRSQSENHEKFEVTNAKNGDYRLEKSFSEEGTYYVYAHVSAKRTHSMPKKEFVIGKPSAPEEKSGSNQMEHD